jgi:hypothetical protein
VGAGDLAYVINGQRVVVHRGACLVGLQARPAHYLALLQPRGAFLGAEGGGAMLSRLWFLFGLYILLGLIFGALCAHRALHSGHDPAAWFGIGLALNVLGYAALLTRGKREVFAPAGVPAGLHKFASTYAPHPCTACGRANHPSAAKCACCGAALQPRFVSEVTRAGLAPGR